VIGLGSILQQTYRIDAELGRGGMGVVFRAAHVRLPKQFAIKILRPDALKDPRAYARFRREAEIASSIGHPNIVEVHDFNQTDDGQPYIVMELLDGMDLAHLLRTRGALPLESTLGIARAIASALMATHSRGVVHRDLKPSNIFIARRGGQEQIKILDFGVSKIANALDDTDPIAPVMGTPAYMAPEQARGHTADVDARADQFALGAILYEMLSGQPAFARQDDRIYQILHRIVNDPPPPLSGPPEPVVRVVLRALAKAPGERYPDVDAMMADLEQATADLVPAPRGTPAVLLAVASRPQPGFSSLSGVASEMGHAKTEPAQPTAPSRRPLGLRLGLAGLALAGLAFGVLHASRRPSPGPTPLPSAAVPAPDAPVRIQLDVTPATARISLGGAPVTGRVVEVARGATAPRLRVEAAGYQAVELPVPTDRDQTLVIVLAATPPAPAQTATSAAPASPPTAPKKRRPSAARPAGELEDPFSSP
jgi:serine/threonine-protein kinase